MVFEERRLRERCQPETRNMGKRIRLNKGPSNMLQRGGCVGGEVR
jgi:hypothetical protein